jgi:cytochrome c
MMRTALLVCGLLLILLGGAAAAYKSVNSAHRATVEAEALTGGDAKAGQAALQNYGCNGCHTTPGVMDARGLVGPPLTQVAERIYIAGVLANTPENLVRWIENPTEINPRTAMPNLHIAEAEARNIAAYLYTLR